MKLELEDGPPRDISSREALREALAGVGSDGNGYAVLSSAEQHYIQAAGTLQRGFRIEFREGSTAAHYSSKREHIPQQDMIELLLAYYEGKQGWKNRLKWDPPLSRARKRAARPAKRGLATYRNAAMLLVFSALALYESHSQHQDTADFERHLVLTSGKVLLAWTTGSKNKRRHISVEYKAGGKPYLFEEQLSGVTYRSGDVVPVVYDARQPGVRQLVRQPDEIWREYYFWILTSGMLGFAGIVLLCFAWYASRRKPR